MPANKGKCPECIRLTGHCFRKTYTVKGKPVPNSRCREHHLALKRAQKTRTHRNRVEVQYSLEPGGYDALKDYQGGHCAICLKATGATRNLSVDHTHKKCCPGTTACPECVRGLLCSQCNVLLGRARDEVAYFERAIDYLNDPPYQRMRRDGLI